MNYDRINLNGEHYEGVLMHKCSINSRITVAVLMDMLGLAFTFVLAILIKGYLFTNDFRGDGEVMKSEGRTWLYLVKTS